jgi:transposase
MARRSFSREFKLEAVRLISERGLSVAQAARDLDVHESVLRKWVGQYREDPANAFPGAGQMKPEQAEIAQLKKEIRKLKAERDMLKKAAASSTGHCKASGNLAGDLDLRGARSLAERVLQLAVTAAK